MKCRKEQPKDKPVKLADGGGLFLHIMPNGGKYWRYRYRFLGKEKTLALGVYPEVTLAEAREKHGEARKLLANDIDPSEKKKLDQLELKTNYNNSFEIIAREWHQNKLHTWKPDHAITILKRLEVNIFRKIGKRPIRMVSAPELLDAIRSLENEGKRDLAHRMLQHCSQIFCYAVATGRADTDITTHLKGALQPVRSKHYAHLSAKELPAFLGKLNCYDTHYNGHILTKLAFQLLILTFVRSGEIRGARWEEINLSEAIWKIPAERMKMKTPHFVPLSSQSITLLKEIRLITGNNPSGYVFPSQKTPHKIMSENTFLRAIDIMGYKDKTTGHGFRSTASTILNENNFARDVIERQLAHCERDQVRAAYNHAEYLPQRKAMMQWWGDYVDSLYSHNKIVPIHLRA